MVTKDELLKESIKAIVDHELLNRGDSFVDAIVNDDDSEMVEALRDLFTLPETVITIESSYSLVMQYARAANNAVNAIARVASEHVEARLKNE